MAAKHAQALSAGASVRATLVAATGPNNPVTGARTTPTSVPAVFDSRFAPEGTLTRLEKNGLCRWTMAQAGQATNQTSWAGSPQAHVNVFAGWPNQTCHHKSTAGTVNNTMAPRWNPSVLAARTAVPPRSADCTRETASGSPEFERRSAVPVSSGSAWVDACLPIITPHERSAAPLARRGTATRLPKIRLCPRVAGASLSGQAS